MSNVKQMKLQAKVTSEYNEDTQLPYIPLGNPE